MAKNKTFLIAGAGGQLACEFQNILACEKFKYFAPREKDLDITNVEQFEDTLKKTKPDIVVNCAAYNLVDEAEENPSVAVAVNSVAVGNMAALCRKYGAFFVHFSSDYVFDGKKGDTYVESDSPCPINAYGESKLEGEKLVQERCTDFLILRLSWVFGLGRQNFLYKVFTWAQKNPILTIVDDEVSTPTYTEDVVVMTLLSLKKGLRGLYHVTNDGHCSRYAWAKYFVETMNLKNSVRPANLQDFPSKAKRPLFSAMSNQKISKNLGVSIPPWQDAVNRFALRFKSNAV